MWFGAIVAVTLQTAFLSPPVAMSAYYLKQVVKDWSLSTIYRGMLEFMGIQVAAIAPLIAFPAIATWLPNDLFSTGALVVEESGAMPAPGGYSHGDYGDSYEAMYRRSQRGAAAAPPRTRERRGIPDSRPRRAARFHARRRDQRGKVLARAVPQTPGASRGASGPRAASATAAAAGSTTLGANRLASGQRAAMQPCSRAHSSAERSSVTYALQTEQYSIGERNM